MPNDPEEVGKRIYDSLGSPLIKSLDDKGITLDYLIDKAKEELEATETKTFQYQGEIVESDPKIAWEVRQRARMHLHRLRGDEIEKHSLTIDNLPVRPLTDEQRLEVEAIKKVLKEEALKKALE